VIHSTVNTAPEKPGRVGGPEWNVPHTVRTREVSTDDALDITDDCIEATGGTVGIELTLLPPAGLGGSDRGEYDIGCHTFKVIKVDAGIGPVTLVGTINGNAGGYVLANQYQYVKVQVKFDESGYLVVDNN
jgi:hypothetical protein